jgi:hypothetical protein
MQDLHELHEDWLLGDRFPRPAPVIVLDANKVPGTVVTSNFVKVFRTKSFSHKKCRRVHHVFFRKGSCSVLNKNLDDAKASFGISQHLGCLFNNVCLGDKI